MNEDKNETMRIREGLSYDKTITDIKYTEIIEAGYEFKVTDGHLCGVTIGLIEQLGYKIQYVSSEDSVLIVKIVKNGGE